MFLGSDEIKFFRVQQAHRDVRDCPYPLCSLQLHGGYSLRVTANLVTSQKPCGSSVPARGLQYLLARKALCTKGAGLGPGPQGRNSTLLEPNILFVLHEFIFTVSFIYGRGNQIYQAPYRFPLFKQGF